MARQPPMPVYRVEWKDGGEPIGICGLLKRESLEDVEVKVLASDA